MKALLFTEGGRKIGFGHVTRCVSLYQAFQEKGIDAEIIINGDRTVADLCKNINHRFFDWRSKKKKTFGIMNKADIAVIDSYLADSEFYKKVSSRVRVPIYMDDNRRMDYPEGIVVNGALGAEKINYPKKQGVSYLLGVKYFPLRKEFWDVPDKMLNKKIISIMVTFGGDNTGAMTQKILKLLTRKYQDIIKKVVIGKGFKDAKEIRLLKDKRTDRIYYPGAKEMKELMIESDLAVSGGGQTLYELARMGLPTIAVALADNQATNIRGWRRAGFIEYAGRLGDGYIVNIVDRRIKNLNSVTKRKEKYRIGRSYIDGSGSKSIVYDAVINRG